MDPGDLTVLCYYMNWPRLNDVTVCRDLGFLQYAQLACEERHGSHSSDLFSDLSSQCGDKSMCVGLDSECGCRLYP